MKNVTLFLSFCFVCLFNQALFSQKLTSSRNYFRCSDMLTKQQVEFKDPGPASKQIEWDFSMLNSIDEKYGLAYFGISEGDTARVIGMEHDTRYYYQLKNDTLWMTGYENRTTHMNFDQPEAQLHYPFHYGDSLNSTFSSTGKY